MDVVRFAGMADLAFHLRRERLLPISWRDWQDKAMWRFSDLYKLPLTSAQCPPPKISWATQKPAVGRTHKLDLITHRQPKKSF
jgi:hypothetical protein